MLTPEQIVRSIKMEEACAAKEIKRVRDREARDVAPDLRTLPKPARVEKWQRWRNQGAEYVVEETRDGAFDRAYFADGQCCSMYEMRASSSWTFLGYAKPDKVEAGQRWHQIGFGVRVVAALECGDKLAKFRDGGAQLCRMITENTTMEYLGMAESAPTVEQANAYAPTDTPLANAFRAYVPDIKSQTRRANEEAAKRLIANPPEWAYPKAWMCAVLAAQEWNNSHTVVPGMELSAIGWWIAVVCELEHRGRERSATIDGIATVVRDAYARGMDRPSPLLTRQGVKRGISTCDLGVDYE